MIWTVILCLPSPPPQKKKKYSSFPLVYLGPVVIPAYLILPMELDDHKVNIEQCMGTGFWNWVGESPNNALVHCFIDHNYNYCSA